MFTISPYKNNCWKGFLFFQSKIVVERVCNISVQKLQASIKFFIVSLFYFICINYWRFTLVIFPITSIRAKVPIKGRNHMFVIILFDLSFIFLNNVMATLKLDIPLFDRRMDFPLWKCMIQDYLVQQGLDCALEKEKPSEIKDSDWNSIQKRQWVQFAWHLLHRLKWLCWKKRLQRNCGIC